eukprot:m.339814 g.339814  ORF g.339814 m.339814 type:complete len:366 (+) comp16543_c6_seq1:4774-5871(+)
MISWLVTVAMASIPGDNEVMEPQFSIASSLNEVLFARTAFIWTVEISGQVMTTWPSDVAPRSAELPMYRAKEAWSTITTGWIELQGTVPPIHAADWLSSGVDRITTGRGPVYPACCSPIPQTLRSRGRSSNVIAPLTAASDGKSTPRRLVRAISASPPVERSTGAETLTYRPPTRVKGPPVRVSCVSTSGDSGRFPAAAPPRMEKTPVTLVRVRKVAERTLPERRGQPDTTTFPPTDGHLEPGEGVVANDNAPSHGSNVGEQRVDHRRGERGVENRDAGHRGSGSHEVANLGCRGDGNGDGRCLSPVERVAGVIRGVRSAEDAAGHRQHRHRPAESRVSHCAPWLNQTAQISRPCVLAKLNLSYI